jgi:hypothetical protein
MNSPMNPQPSPNEAQVLAAVCAVMEVALADISGKTTPRTKPRLQWARNMAAFVMHDLGISDGAIARCCGEIHRITIMVRRRRMAEKLETTQRYRDHHMAILQRLAASRALAATRASEQEQHASAGSPEMAEPHKPSPIPSV